MVYTRIVSKQGPKGSALIVEVLALDGRLVGSVPAPKSSEAWISVLFQAMTLSLYEKTDDACSVLCILVARYSHSYI